MASTRPKPKLPAVSPPAGGAVVGVVAGAGRAAKLRIAPVVVEHRRRGWKPSLTLPGLALPVATGLG